ERGDASGSVSRDDDAFGTEVFEQRIDEAVRVDAVRVAGPVVRQDNRVAFLSLATPGQPVGEAPGIRESGAEEARLEEIPRIGEHRQVRADRRFRELRRVDVHDDLEGTAGKVLPVVADLADRQAATDDQEEVRVLDGKVPGAVADRSLPSDITGVIVPEQVVRVEAGDHGDSPAGRELEELAFGARD